MKPRHKCWKGTSMVRQQVTWMMVLILGILVTTVEAQSPGSKWKIVGYYPSWGTYAANTR